MRTCDGCGTAPATDAGFILVAVDDEADYEEEFCGWACAAIQAVTVALEGTVDEPEAQTPRLIAFLRALDLRAFSFPEAN